MNRRIVFSLAIVGGVLIGHAIAGPGGAGAGAGSTSGSGAGSTSGSGAGSMSGSGAGSTSGSGSAAGPTLNVPPGLTPVAPPMKAPTLAMRPRTHGGFIDNMDCSACHTPGGWDLGPRAGLSGFDHDRTAFPLRGAHKQTECGGCHTSTGAPSSTCEACHADPHQGRQAGACAECHNPSSWTDTAAFERHRLTRMPLTGRHATVDCVACHKRQGERQWSDVPLDCYSCHRAEFHGDTHPTHDGRLDVAGQPTPMASRECGRCHQTTAWKPAICTGSLTPCPSDSNLPRTLTPSPDHDVWFVLTTGSHRATECTACHADARRPKAVRCDGCHADVTLRRQHEGAAVPRGSFACLRCHPRGAAR